MQQKVSPASSQTRQVAPASPVDVHRLSNAQLLAREYPDFYGPNARYWTKGPRSAGADGIEARLR